MPVEQPDATLVRRACQGSKEAFGELVLRHRRTVLGVAYRISGSSALAEDVAQEAFLQAWTQLPTLRDPQAFRSWLYRLAVRCCIDQLRRRREAGPLDEEVAEDAEALPEDELLARERALAVRKAVLALPEHSRAALILREFEGLSYKEIAETLDIPVGTVMSRLNYARALLRGALGPYLRAPTRTEEE